MSTRQTTRVVDESGGFTETESAPDDSVELSMSAAQAKEQGLRWAVTVKCYAPVAAEAGEAAHDEMQRQIELAK